MQYCARCFEYKCKCNSYRFEIDYFIYPAIYELNRKGYRTGGCCSGHSDRERLNTYISFISDVDAELDSEYVQFESYNYRGAHVRKNKILPRPEIINKFKKKRTNKVEYIRIINKELYEWAKSLPEKELSQCIKEKRFADDYFTEERLIGDQSPWILLCPGFETGNDVISDYLNAVTDPAISSLIFVGPRNQIIKYDRESEVSLEKRMKDAVCFAPKIFIFGKNGEIHLDRISVNDSYWSVAYTNPDDSFYIDEDEVDDYLYEHHETDLMSVFRMIFEMLISKGSNLCIFSAGENHILFANREEFAYHVGFDYSAFLTGEIDYDEMELRHVEPKKEVFLFTNGTLFFREELT